MPLGRMLLMASDTAYIETLSIIRKGTICPLLLGLRKVWWSLESGSQHEITSRQTHRDSPLKLFAPTLCSLCNLIMCWGSCSGRTPRTGGKFLPQALTTSTRSPCVSRSSQHLRTKSNHLTTNPELRIFNFVRSWANASLFAVERRLVFSIHIIRLTITDERRIQFTRRNPLQSPNIVF